MKKIYWLLKSEPKTWSWNDQVREKTTMWDGVRNYQARNIMRDDMKVGDLVLFYHSNTKPPHVAAVARVVKEGYPDHTSWDVNSKYYDEKSSPDKPRWIMVDIEPVRELPRIISLNSIRENDRCEGMLLIRKGQRLSVQPVEEIHFDAVLDMVGLSRDEL